MKKKLSIIALCLVVIMCFTTLVACDLSGIELDTPVVTINNEGLARWKAVDNAKSYVCNVNGREVETIYTLFQLKDGESISVKAVSGGSPYKNSKWSETKTYNASSSGNQGESGKIKLATPVVTISQSGLASWDSVANASEYEYTINGTTVGKPRTPIFNSKRDKLFSSRPSARAIIPIPTRPQSKNTKNYANMWTQMTTENAINAGKTPR